MESVKDVSPSTAQAGAVKNHAALSSMAWSIFLTVLKFAAGFASNSIGLISEGLHSLLDSIAATLTWLAVRWAQAPPDRHYPFGHGKIENLSALAETLLLFLTCCWIVYEALERLFFAGAPVDPTWWAFLVLAISVAVDLGRSAMLYRVAKKYRSQALAADALHFSTDILSTSVVLAGLCCVWAAQFTPNPSPLHTFLCKADAIAALAVAVLVFGASWRMGQRAFSALMDGGTEEETRKVRQALASRAPAFRVRKLRVRKSGPNYFVEITIEAPPAMRVDDSHEICSLFEEIVAGVLPDTETTIHIEPRKMETPDLYGVARNMAAMRGLEIHALALTRREDGLHIYFHIELAGNLALAEAHKLVSAYETDLCRHLCASHVISHIEPLEYDERPEPLHSPPARDKILAALAEIAARHPEVSRISDREIWLADADADLSFRCQTAGERTVAEIHRIASRMEAEIRDLLPGMGRISIQFEPDGAESCAKCRAGTQGH